MHHSQGHVQSHFKQSNRNISRPQGMSVTVIRTVPPSSSRCLAAMPATCRKAVMQTNMPKHASIVCTKFPSVTAQQRHHCFLIFAHYQASNVPVQFVVHSLVCEQTPTNNANPHLAQRAMTFDHLANSHKQIESIHRH